MNVKLLNVCTQYRVGEFFLKVIHIAIELLIQFLYGNRE